MLVLNIDKENLLKNYGFEKKQFPSGDSYYTFGKSIKIFSLNCTKNFKKRAGTFDFMSFSKDVQDIVYHLIKDNIVTCIPIGSKKIIEMQKEIDNLNKQISEMKKEMEVTKDE